MTGQAWTALILAGQRPGIDPLAAQFQQEWKALTPIDGEAMLSRVAKTLLALSPEENTQAPTIGHIVVMAQDPNALLTGDCTWMAKEDRITTAVSGSGIANSIISLIDKKNITWPLLVTTADHPLLTKEMVAEFLSKAQESDLSVGVVSRSNLLKSYPENRRTWLCFSDDAYSGANLFAMANDKVKAALQQWAEIEQNRKKAWQLIRHFGLCLAIRAITRSISFKKALNQVGNKLGLTINPVVLSQPEAGIDVDKLSDYQLAERILKNRKQI
ncbi:MAG: nucleotidyltransferase family protein [Zymomonas mobilis]|uniref:MobA-like NTP transferase protein n=1 Tax=Zymomonas mobilis TaxID=542 RepID=A0A542VZ96_ZYMMB|nr:nucleotidyltransferase family protein [Zymomonas mobilis]TQL16644.1 MobA-like NTP transferase protein [Zymomonas mobilis]